MKRMKDLCLDCLESYYEIDETMLVLSDIFDALNQIPENTAYGCLEIAVERLDEFGNTEECSTDDYDCDDKTLWAMIENAIL